MCVQALCVGVPVGYYVTIMLCVVCAAEGWRWFSPHILGVGVVDVGLYVGGVCCGMVSYRVLKWYSCA